ncbi:hypothetical protein OG785_32610 [Streptomyces sp. NBC_00006]|uniref:DUF7927 domain-containing protein n=1 Tax=Streptomyces sp. NBC_00006 TaxID=2975619 RepID=UPI002259CCF3|nr:hypothetical protein [Streptomyces sp. NBC_00006]MCX5535279.1 hypothetical protein [Streptomyces sp. NBC_00006]
MTLGTAMGTAVALPAMAEAPSEAAKPQEHARAAAAAEPGVPDDPTVVYDENFENNPAPQPIKLTDYTGGAASSNMTYTADEAWLTNCNGWVLNKTDSEDFADGISECAGSDTNWNNLRNITDAIGMNNGTGTPPDNHAVAAYTSADPGADKVEFETERQIPLTSRNRFLTASVTSGASACEYAQPNLNFFLLDGSTSYSVSDKPINPCTDPKATTYTKADTGFAKDINVVNNRADSPMIYPGSSLGIRMTNATGVYGGNDAAFDDIKIEDVTPHVEKSFSPDAVAVGGTSKLTFTVTNTSDLMKKEGWSFTDDLPAGLTVADPAGTETTCSNGAVDTSAGSGTVDLKGDLKEGQTSCTLSVDVTSDQAGSYENCAESNMANLQGVNPQGCALVVFDKPSYTLSKTSTPADGSTVGQGDTVEYSVKVENTGDVPVDATANDDLSDVLDDAKYNGDAKASTGDVSYDDPNLKWSGTLDPGETATITYSVTVEASDGSNAHLGNAVTGNDYSNCDTGTEDGCNDQHDVMDLDITKSADTATAKAGDKVTYTVKVTNHSADDVSGAEVSDDLSGVLDDAAYNGDATASSGSVSYDDPNLKWSGDIPAGETVTITYSATVNSPDKGDHQLTNTVTGPGDSNCAKGSDDTDCQTLVPVAELQIAKTSDADKVKPGDKVTYTVTVKNVGEADYDSATLTDDMSNALDDAVYNGDATTDTGDVSYDAPNLTWSGDLPSGQTATLTYSMTVKDPITGNGTLANAVVGPDGSNCAAGSDDPACGTSAEVTPDNSGGELPDTGPSTGTLIAALASVFLLGLGVLLTTAVRRSRK